MKTIVISSYSISFHIKELVSKYINNEFDLVYVNELKNKGVFALLKYLFSIKHDRMLIVAEEDSAVSILPTIKILCLMTRANKFEVMFGSGKVEQFTKFDVLRYLIIFILSNISARFSYIIKTAQAYKLQNEPRIDLNFPENINSIIYIKSNIWFGVKAGGSVGHIAGVVNGFLRKGYKVFFFGAEKPHMVDSEINYMKSEIPSVLAFPPEINSFAFDRILYEDILKSQLQFKNAAIYQRLSVENITGVLISRKLKIPLILEYNGSEVWVFNNWGKALRYQKVASIMEDVCLKHAHRIVTISNVLRDELISKGVEPDRIVMYPNCIDERIYNPLRFSDSQKINLRKKLGFNENDIICTFVGTFGPWHGVEFLAECIVEMAKENEEWLKRNNIRFLLIGDGALMNKVKEILSNLKIKDLVKLTGLVEQENTPSYLSLSDVLLSPHVKNKDGSKFFGSPTKLFEYMAMEKPIIASRLDQIEEVLGGNNQISSESVTKENDLSKLAVLFNPNDKEDFKNKFRNLIENLNDLSVIGKNARSEALSKYTWSKHVDFIINSFK